MKDAKLIDDIISLYIGSRLCKPVRTLLDEETIDLARKIPGYPDINIIPMTMIASSPDSMGYSQWMPVPSPIDIDMTKRFESFLDYPIPYIFKCYLTCKCLIGTNFDEAILPEIRPEEPLGWLQWASIWMNNIRDIIEPGIVPFTYGPFTCSLLCFDARASRNSEEFPIVKISPSSESIFKVFDNTFDYFEFVKNTIIYKSKDRDMNLIDWLHFNNLKKPYFKYFDY